MRLLIQNESGLTCCFQPTTKQEDAVSTDWHRTHIAHLLWQFYCERRPLRLEGHQVNHFNRGEEISTAWICLAKTSDAIQVSSTQDTETWGALLLIQLRQLPPSIRSNIVGLASSWCDPHHVSACNIDFVLMDIHSAAETWSARIHRSHLLHYDFSTLLNFVLSHCVQSFSWLLVVWTTDDIYRLVWHLSTFS